MTTANLQFFTNGDYLTGNYLNELVESGVNTIIMSYYSKEDNQFDLEIIKPYMDKMAKKLDFWNILY
ncbi:hypothetical protein NEI00_02930 [Brachyspira pilosicoli]|uniref:hypothetical protein n=1 Tax=Brachyspira pilosicoli TaxID=52584 RepID=UPI0025433981|nr:hypothetical protein [Brachyspira pilosicoli]WIH84150.1 hypothetical protein NEI00_02930 [Brachyspira pilosicoli]